MTSNLGPPSRRRIRVFFFGLRTKEQNPRHGRGIIGSLIDAAMKLEQLTIGLLILQIGKLDFVFHFLRCWKYCVIENGMK